jgi:hypothetical protein
MRVFSLVAAAVLLVWAAPAAAAVPCSEFLCGIALDCGNGDVAACSPDGCFCRRACNAERDCTNDQTCWNGQCVAALSDRCESDYHCPSGQVCSVSRGRCFEPCNARRDCPSGQVCTDGQCQPCAGDSQCGSGQRCASGLCETVPGPSPTPVPTPECASARDCTDLNPCNGQETCDGFFCQRGPKPCPPVTPPSTNRCVREPADSQCTRCELKLVVVKEMIDAELLLPERERPTQPVLPWAGRASVRETIAPPPPRDYSSSRVRVAVVDAKGVPLVDHTVEPGAWDPARQTGWSGGPKEGYTFRDERKDGLIRKLAIVPDPKSPESFTIVIDGVLAGGKPLDALLSPTLAVHVQWKEDVASTLMAARRLQCGRQTEKGKGGLRCVPPRAK